PSRRGFLPGGERTAACTWTSGMVSSRSTRWPPTNPPAPVIKTRTMFPPRGVEPGGTVQPGAQQRLIISCAPVAARRVAKQKPCGRYMLAGQQKTGKSVRLAALDRDLARANGLGFRQGQRQHAIAE